MKRKISECESNMEGNNIYNDTGLMSIPKRYVINLIYTLELSIRH